VHPGTLINQKDNTLADVAGVFKYTGNCPADIYIEAGIINAPVSGLLSFLPSEFNIEPKGAPSNCDGNLHYNGAVYHVEPGADIKFRLKPENYGVASTYPVNVGAYWGGTRTGCINFGGTTLTEFHNGRTSFSDSYSVFDLGNSYIQVTS